MIYGFDKKWALPFSPKQFHISTTRNFYNQYTVFIFILKAYIFYSDIPSLAYPLVSIQRAGKDPAGRVERSARENQEKKEKKKSRGSCSRLKKVASGGGYLIKRGGEVKNGSLSCRLGRCWKWMGRKGGKRLGCCGFLRVGNFFGVWGWAVEERVGVVRFVYL